MTSSENIATAALEREEATPGTSPSVAGLVALQLGRGTELRARLVEKVGG